MLSSNRDVDAALHLLFEANRVLRDAGDQLAMTAGQTHARRMVLQSATAPSTVAGIARSLGLQRQGVQRIADELVSEGLARYQDNPRHKRSKLFIVTEAGQSSLAAIENAHVKWLDEIEAGAPKVDWILLRRNLEQLLTWFKSPPTTH